MIRITSAAAAAALILIAAPRTSAAQASAQDHQEMEMMGDSMPAGKHLRLTPHWPAQPGDQARADSMVNRRSPSTPTWRRRSRPATGCSRRR
jgi:hypothetical protein